MQKSRLWLPVCLYCAAIFYLSGMDKLPDVAQQFPDKLEHMVLYAGLGMLTARALSRGVGLSRAGTLICSALFCLAYGLTDELHQWFVPGRSSEAGDVLADFLGGLLGAYCYCLLTRLREAPSREAREGG